MKDWCHRPRPEIPCTVGSSRLGDCGEAEESAAQFRSDPVRGAARWARDAKGSALYTV